MLQKYYYLDLEIPLRVGSDHDTYERDEVVASSNHKKLQYKKSYLPELNYVTINNQLKEQDEDHRAKDIVHTISNLEFVTMNCQLMDKDFKEHDNREVEKHEEMEYKVDYQSYNYCHEDICPIRRYHQRAPNTCNAPINSPITFHQVPAQHYKDCSAIPAYPPACMCECKDFASQTPRNKKKKSTCCTSNCCAKPKKEKPNKPVKPIRQSVEEFPLCTPSHDIWKEQYRRQHYMFSANDNQCLPEASPRCCTCKCLVNNAPQRPQLKFCCEVERATSAQCCSKHTKEACVGPPSSNSEDYFGVMAKIKHMQNVETMYNYEMPRRCPSRSDKSQDTADEFFKMACGAPTAPTKEVEPGHKILLLRTQSKPVQIINCKCRLPEDVQAKINKLGNENTGKHCTCLFI